MSLKKYHFTALGGSVMHNLAIVLKEHGHTITGSDDEINEPSRSRLQAAGLLPAAIGWNPDLVSTDLDGVIVGMHARPDNPEIQKAQALGIPLISFPDFIFEASKNKQRVVVAGSHGKTTITAIILHVLEFYKRSFDYVIGSRVSGLTHSVRLSHDAPIIIIEGDEYFSSPLDRTPKFLRYQHHIGVISGIAWDHANVFPTEDEYIRQFDAFADATPKGGILVFNELDAVTAVLCNKERPDVLHVPFKTHPYELENGQVILISSSKERIPLRIFGKHNLMNIAAAKEVLKKIGVTAEQFYKAIPTFVGAAGRLDKIREDKHLVVFKDFAHAPSKVRATTEAVKELYNHRPLTGVLELHTFSSLLPSFLPNYKNTMKACSEAIIFVDPEKVKTKGSAIDAAMIQSAFQHPNLHVVESTQHLHELLLKKNWTNQSLLLMSSGAFGGLDIAQLTAQLKA
jgi:UDP-N-acetylmuramate: L-alanyl-gamma-D-glutamyl-meso-diaminopimelate ligase